MITPLFAVGSVSASLSVRSGRFYYSVFLVLYIIIIIIIIIIMAFQYRRCYDMIGNDGDTKDLH